MLAGGGSDLFIVVIWYCGVCSCVCLIVIVSPIDRVCSDPMAQRSVCEAGEERSARADGFGRTARVMAALRRMGIWISCFHLCWRFFFFCGHLLTVAARCNVRCVLQGSGDCWVWSPSCCPNQGSMYVALNPKVWNFSSVVKALTIKSCLRCMTSDCCCVGGCHTRPEPHCVSRQQRWCGLHL